MSLVVRRVEERDAEGWASLYRGYRAFYQLIDSADVVTQTWQWVVSGEHSLIGLVAVDDEDEPLAMANLRWFARPSTATLGLYVDDLFTGYKARRRGAGTALLRCAANIAADGGASVVRWVTASGNETARRLYDDVATATNWVTYDMQPVSPHAG